MTARKYNYEKYINNSQKLREFLKSIDNKPARHRAYKLHLVRYFQNKNIQDVDSYIKDTRRLDKDEKIDYLDNLGRDLTTYWKELNRETIGKTPYIWLSAMKMFLIFNKTFELDDVFMQMQRNGHGNYAITDTQTPTREQLLKIFSYSDPESKALFMFQLTSGQRISQVVNTTFDNIDLGFECPRVRYPTSKQHFWVKTRITPETKKVLQDYLEQRDKFNLIRDKRGEYKRKTHLSDNLVFKMTSHNAEMIWNTMVRNAGLYKLDPITKRPVLGTHCLRRYFLTHFGDETWGDFFSGHITARNKEYRKYNEERLDEEYTRHKGDLAIFETAPDLSGINQEMQEKDKQIEELKKAQLEEKLERLELKQKLAELEKQLEKKLGK